VQTALRRTQEVVIGGWVPARRDSATMLGALLVGVPTEAGLRYAGKVSLGLSDAARQDLRDRLGGLEQRVSPFIDTVPAEIARQAWWVVPELLGEVSYRRWTAHGRLGHPTWTGLRHGKHPAAVRGPLLLTAALQAVPAGAGIDPREQTDEGELEEALRQARAEVAALRMQISPHFLYNALSAIAALVRTDPPRARELLMEFAGFTRYSLRPATEFTTLADELENIDRYLELEKARLEERLQVTIQVAPQLYPVVLPFLALQLVVENAVRNGVELVPGGGKVAISVVAEGSDCLITVAADGPETPAGSDLGDLEGRLRSVFGDDYSLMVDGAAGAGTTVTLRVPQIRNEPHSVR
jgi:signal transduction histidine kinase